MDKESHTESLEEAIFKTLSHQTRRDILRFIGERKSASFTEIKSMLKIDDSASLSYHLNTLQPLINQEGGRYNLTALGQDTYALICKTTAYSESNATLSFLRTALPWVIIANAILWGLAYYFNDYYGGELLIAFWFISNLVLYGILVKTGKKPCIIKN